MLRELAARLKRERLLRYACRELEMQRLLMAKGGRKKLRGVEPLDNEEDGEDEEGEGHSASSWRSGDPVSEREYRPREYKWRLERKR
jgi:U3 small nucleolar RNA-associated protein 11